MWPIFLVSSTLIITARKYMNTSEWIWTGTLPFLGPTFVYNGHLSLCMIHTVPIFTQEYNFLRGNLGAFRLPHVFCISYVNFTFTVALKEKLCVVPFCGRGILYTIPSDQRMFLPKLIAAAIMLNTHVCSILNALLKICRSCRGYALKVCFIFSTIYNFIKQ